MLDIAELICCFVFLLTKALVCLDTETAALSRRDRCRFLVLGACAMGNVKWAPKFTFVYSSLGVIIQIRDGRL